MLVEGVLPLSAETATGDHVLIHGVELGYISVPMHKVFLQSDLVSGYVTVGIRPTLPVVGVSLLLGNDIAGERVTANPLMSSLPFLSDSSDQVTQDIPGLYPACAVTRSMTKQQVGMPNDQVCDWMGENCSTLNAPVQSGSGDESDGNIELSTTFFPTVDNPMIYHEDLEPVQGASLPTPLSTRELIKQQELDTGLTPLLQDVLCEKEAAKVPTCFYKKSGVLMRKWRLMIVPSGEEWQVSHQIVVPFCYRNDVLHLAHDSPLAGHLGINKTYQRVLLHFYWPGLHKDVANFCKACHTCQVVGKPNQHPPNAPLKPIPAVAEPFSRVLIDCVGPLPKTKSGNQYLLKKMCVATRFPEAVPLRNIEFRASKKFWLQCISGKVQLFYNGPYIVWS